MEGAGMSTHHGRSAFRHIGSGRSSKFAPPPLKSGYFELPVTGRRALWSRSILSPLSRCPDSWVGDKNPVLRHRCDRFLSSGQAGAENPVRDRLLSHHIHVHDIIPWRQRIAEGEFEVAGFPFQREMLIADRGGAAYVVDGEHDEG